MTEEYRDQFDQRPFQLADVGFCFGRDVDADIFRQDDVPSIAAFFVEDRHLGFKVGSLQRRPSSPTLRSVSGGALLVPWIARLLGAESLRRSRSAS